MKKMVLAVALAAAAAAPAWADTFATFSPNSTQNVTYTGAADGTGMISSVAAPVTFHFIDFSSPTGTTDVAALFNLTAATGAGTITNGVLASAPVTSGTFSITANSATSFNGNTGTNLLSGTFSGGLFTAVVGGSTASLLNSLPPVAVNFTSSFFDFTGTTERDIQLGFEAIMPRIGTTNGNFTGTADGEFGANLSSGSPGTIPEPASWALMVAGFGLVGTMARRRSSTALTA